MQLGEQFLIYYHNGEEILIAVLCGTIAWRTLAALRPPASGGPAQKNRIVLFASGFLILAGSSLTHALIHALHLNLNLLYQTLLGYCLGLFILMVSLSAEKTGRAVTLLPFLYLPLLLLLIPKVSECFPLFGSFRPLIWVSVSYLAGVVGMLFFAIYHRSRSYRFLDAAIGFSLLCVSSAFLFFPAAIGSPAWLIGHLLRPMGFLLIFNSLRHAPFTRFNGSILYRALTSFSLLAAIPLLTFGTLLFYENLSPVTILGEKLLIFLLLFVTLSSALFFGLGMIIRLIRPILQLKESVDRVSEKGLDNKIPIVSDDEIGELSAAFNQMTSRLGSAIEEQERMCRLAATGELAATLAHEIKNPLNAIGGAVDYLRKNYQGSLLQEFLKIIREETTRIDTLTSALLSFSKPLTPEPQASDINQLIRDILLLLSQEFKDQNITVDTDLDEQLPAFNCDANQIKQILINLLINAIDAIDRQEGRIRVVTRGGHDELAIEVHDSGKGIPANTIKEIFNPFFTTKTRGTGIGLAISKTIAREHNGDLLVRSTPGLGSVFTLILREAPDSGAL